MGVTEAEVRLAYKLLLAREPETEEAVRRKVTAQYSLEEMRREFVSSEEYIAANPSLSRTVAINYEREKTRIDVDVTPAVLAQLVDHVIAQWEKLGVEDPYWSVLTHDEFKVSNITEAAKRSLYETGKQNADLIEIFERRAEVAPRRDSCLELGCGVGRVTKFLAEKFENVTAVDISSGNLKLCEAYLKKHHVRNVDLVLLRSGDQLRSLRSFGFLYSMIVLQHNAPPVQKMILDCLLPKLLPGGSCLFQTPDSFLDYEFDAERFLLKPDGIIDTHCLPRPVVLRLLQEHGLFVRDVVPDGWLGPMLGSYTYFATRPNRLIS